MNALLAGAFGVPVVFVSGCNLLAKEAQSTIPEINTSQVKRTVNQVVSENSHPDMAQDLIKEGVKDALLNYESVPPYRLPDEAFRFELQFCSTLFADIADTLPVVTKKIH